MAVIEPREKRLVTKINPSLMRWIYLYSYCVFYLIFDELFLTAIHCQQVDACMQVADG